MQRERKFLKARLPQKGLANNSTSLPTRNLAGERLPDAERLSRANMNSTVYTIILKCTQLRRVAGSLFEKPGVLRNAPASEKRPELM